MAIYSDDYDCAKAVKEFDDERSGVKGLVNAGITKLSRLFVHLLDLLQSNPAHAAKLELPTMDLEGLRSGRERRREVVEEIRKASEEWGFFLIINHDISSKKMDAMLEGVKRFHEQPTEAKKPLYSDDSRKRVMFNIKSQHVSLRRCATPPSRWWAFTHKK